MISDARNAIKMKVHIFKKKFSLGYKYKSGKI